MIENMRKLVQIGTGFAFSMKEKKNRFLLFFMRLHNEPIQFLGFMNSSFHTRSYRSRVPLSLFKGAPEQRDANSGRDENTDHGAHDVTEGERAAATGNAGEQFRDKCYGPKSSKNGKYDLNDFHLKGVRPSTRIRQSRTRSSVFLQSASVALGERSSVRRMAGRRAGGNNIRERKASEA